MHIRQGLVVFLIVIHLILGCITMYFLYEYSIRFQTKYEHALVNLAAMLVMVVAMCIYRICQGLNTRGLKYIHMAIHCGIVLLVFSAWGTITDEDGTIKKWDFMHGFPAYVACGGYLLQMVLAVFFLIIVFPVGSFRFQVAIIHDIIGLWLYDCFLGAAISGWHYCGGELDIAEMMDTGVESDACVRVLDYYKTMIIVNSFFVHFILLFPHFQWDVVGSI